MYSNNLVNSPLAPDQLNKVNQAVQDLKPNQLAWVSGFLAGMSEQSSAVQHNISKNQLTILFASQTGNCRNLAEQYYQKCQSLKINCQLKCLSDYKPRDITREKYAVIIVSTHGEGEAPDDAEIFYEYLFSKKQPNLNNLKYSILALGDSSYEKFCQTGIDIDIQLQKLGASSVIDRIDCDLDYEDSFEIWQKQTSQYFAEYTDINSKNTTPLSLLKSPTNSLYNKNNTYKSEILTIQKITTHESIKNVYHIELDIEGSGIHYQPGDSLGIVSQNSSFTIDSVIHSLDFDGNKSIQIQNQKHTFESALSDLEITLINKKFLKKYAELTQSDSLRKIVDDHKLFMNYVSKRQLSDVLSEFPSSISEQQLVDNLKPITPRLYSIASSQTQNSDEIHLTVALVESSTNQINSGLVSGHLCQHLNEGDSIEIYAEENHHFKLPQNNDAPIIMIAAGTGIAPFRGFLQERQANKATGKNWLIFGNPSFENDFLYQIELQKNFNENLLNRVDLAFSRDQNHKLYVQHKIKQNSEEIWNWLEQGAHLYICGNKDNMAKAVESELVSLISKHGELNSHDAKQFLTSLKRKRRYQKDVY